MLVLLSFWGMKKKMYLRNQFDYNISASKPHRRPGPAEVFIFTFILIIALFASSLTEKESAGFWNSNPLSLEATSYCKSGIIGLSGKAESISLQSLSEYRSNGFIMFRVQAKFDKMKLMARI